MKPLFIAKTIARTITISAIMLAVQAGAQIEIHPESEADFGSGASSRQDFYIAGQQGKGMFVGHPNPFSRRDRALVRFNLTQFVDADDLTKAELTFYVDRVIPNDDGEPRTLLIEHLLSAVDELDGAAVITGEAKEIGTVEVHPHHQIYPDRRTDERASTMPEPVTIDVTKFLKEHIASGMLSITFRFRDTAVEEAWANENRDQIGVIISTEAMTEPRLVCETK